MKHNKAKGTIILMVISLLILQGCNNNIATYESQGIGAKKQSTSVEADSNQAEQSSSTEEISKQAEEIIRNEKTPKVTEFILGPGDHLEVSVYRNDDLTREVWIAPSGEIMYPLTGDIHAAGLSIFQLRDKIRDGLSKYIVNPQVTIRIMSIKSQRVIILGEVYNPGYFLSDTPMTALDAISQAGGFTYDGEKKSVMLIRGGMNNPELRALNLEKALKEGDLTDNVMLKGGDIIYVPRTFISDLAGFFAYLSDIISPIVSVERGYLLGREIRTGETTSIRAR